MGLCQDGSLPKSCLEFFLTLASKKKKKKKLYKSVGKMMGKKESIWETGGMAMNFIA